ncbi:S-methyl-5-thioribose-1-phosphate isomerase [Candidatus Caldatribacterium sp.]|uniref:S-methyl-5-thioribose-1-phosphate isomerase n=1 Tax=Candidatus Caldatribacterium sp. TaxID=2282143 RepID=UPI002999AD9D|nr:S-methyl-5-thioribose-1-phosphate isomerase [Candidatus Caldatribacterium sp.]MDW8080841.1 S-methyl-5-thioribose-1-phosphate isomerase [Candidatus Calescibacterium sp.]
MFLRALEWKGRSLRFLDQTRLPREEVYVETEDYRDVVEAIKRLRIRGAPLIGVAAAYGLCLGAFEGLKSEDFFSFLEQVDHELRSTRPTAVNLFWALDRMRIVWSVRNVSEDWEEVVDRLVAEAKAIDAENALTSERIACFGATLFEDGDRVLTHCNTGPLACGGWGTALGAILWAVHKEGKRITVYADETRPLFQGARLTAFELLKSNIPVTLVCDNMAGFLMSQGHITKVIVGADRIAMNGDVANKIGTYTVAVLAHHHGIPFYVAAPLSTVDPEAQTGADIPIEERDAQEVTTVGGVPIAPPGITVRNPAFDVTPSSLVHALVTEEGIVYPPFEEKLKILKKKRRGGHGSIC